MRLALKRALIGTPVGRWASSIRDAIQLLRTPRVALGTTVNDQLALTLLVKLCRPGETFVDVGAHIGSVVAAVKHRCPKAHIVAFEAIPDKVTALRRKFPNVTIHSCALAEEEGEVDFFIDVQSSGYSSLAAPHGKNVKIRVRKKRLDQLVDWVDLLKIDVEGAELGVLRGAEKLISKCRPIIMFESGPGNVLGFTKEAMFEFFARHDYGLMAPNRLAHTGGVMALDSFLDSHEYPRRTTNYFAVPMSRFDEFRARAACSSRAH